MPSSKASGTQTAVIGTEHTLATITDAGNYYLKVDTSAMQAGDVLELRCWDKVLTVEALAYGPPEGGTFSGVQLVPIKISPPIAIDVQYRPTLKQTAGTGRAFPWKVLSL